MLTIVIDIAVGYILAKRVQTTLFAVLLSISIAVLAAISLNVILHYIGGGLFTSTETITGILVGFVLHPAIALCSLFYFRRRKLFGNRVENDGRNP